MASPARPDMKPLGGFPNALGITVAHLPDGTAEVKLEIGPHHLNYEDAVHGGVLGSLADTAISRAIRARVDDDKAIMTVSLTVSFIRAATKGTLVARGFATSVGRNAAFGRAEIRCGDVLVAEGQGTWLIRDRKPSTSEQPSNKEGTK